MENKTPTLLTIDPGTHYWCRCGKSTNFPWCNGEHRGTEITPLAETITERKIVAICTCPKKSSNLPFCDGSHKNP